MAHAVGRLHVLTDQAIQKRYSHVALAEQAAAGGADCIQLRWKEGPMAEIVDQARKIAGFCRALGVTFIVNDRLEVAMAARADGIHLGRRDTPIVVARHVLGQETIIGGSASTLDEALRCRDEGADYIGFGPVFATTTKPDAGPVSGLAGLEEVVRAVDLPVIAVGGIDRTRVPQVMAAGAWGVAVISAVCSSQDPEKATRYIRHALRESLRGGRMES